MSGEVVDHDSANFFTVGIHPWQIENQIEDNLFQQLKQMLQQENIIALGESGLDRAINTPFEKQIPVFRKQAELAEQMKIPLIIHAVRSQPEIIRIRKEIKASQKWIVHGFTGNAFEAEQLINNGFSISVGSKLLHPNSIISKFLHQIPVDRIFFETDESEILIETIYEFASSILKLSVTDLQKQIFVNFTSHFNKTCS